MLGTIPNNEHGYQFVFIHMWVTWLNGLIDIVQAWSGKGRRIETRPILKNIYILARVYF